MLIFLASFGVIGAALFVYFSPYLARKWEERGLARSCRDSRTMVLSYDDGPGTRLTPALLDLLAQHGARASFFASGKAVSGNEEILDRIVAEGHELGCHAHDHRNAWKSWPSDGLADIAAGYRALARWIPGDAIFRPPHGKMTLPTWWAVRRRGAPLGWWTIVSGDTPRERRAPEEAARELRAAQGGVILLHDFDREPERDGWVLDATRALLETSRSEGLEVRTLGEVLEVARS
jgi:peptidoglycan/xylan/chitin deacetylase (PgdA/CDA1 family)